MELRQRRVVARVVRFGLVVLAIVLAVGWMSRDRRDDGPRLGVQSAAPDVAALGPGDVQLFNEDTTVDVILVGDRISAGLAPPLVARIREEMAQAAAKETSGIGGSIARVVTQTVADRIGTRVTWPVDDIRDLRYDNGRLVVEWRSGKEGSLLGNVKVEGDRDANRFREAEARRFIEAVRARQRAAP